MAAAPSPSSAGAKPASLLRRVHQVFNPRTSPATLVSNVQRAWRVARTKPAIHTDIVDLLAQELVEEFAEYLYTDIGSLKNCSRVCRSWPVSGEITEVFLVLEDFLDKTPHIARHVHAISLSSATESTHPNGTSLTILRRVMEKIPRLRSMTLNVVLSDIYSILTPSLPSTRLHRLEIGSLVLAKQEPGYLSRLLPLLPPADELVFSSPHCNVERRRLQGLTAVEGSQLLRIPRLTFTEPCGYQSAESVLDLLPHIADMASLTRLSFSAPLPLLGLMEAVTHIATLATNLVDIHIAFNVCHKVGDLLHQGISALSTMDIGAASTIFTDPPNLSPCVSLRRLSVSFDAFARGFTSPIQDLAQWRRTITQLRRSPSGLTSLKLSITVPCRSGTPGCSGLSIVTSLPWDTLDDILRRFNELERVTICIVPACFVDENESAAAEAPLNLRATVRERFSPENAGLLHVTFSEGSYEQN